LRSNYLARHNVGDTESHDPATLIGKRDTVFDKMFKIIAVLGLLALKVFAFPRGQQMFQLF
jgi:hypothetical protein